jgi:hypothetical protein
MAGTAAPVPWNTAVIQLDPQGKPLPGFTMSKDFGNWFFSSVVAPAANTPQFYPSVNLTAQNAAIGTTPIPLPALANGAYRISWYLRKTTADGTSSSVQLTISWTEGAVALSLSGAALATDAVTAVQSNSITILIDAATPISYSTTYASNTPGTMKYRLFILVESV